MPFYKTLLASLALLPALCQAHDSSEKRALLTLFSSEQYASLQRICSSRDQANYPATEAAFQRWKQVYQTQLNEIQQLHQEIDRLYVETARAALARPPGQTATVKLDEYASLRQMVEAGTYAELAEADDASIQQRCRNQREMFQLSLDRPEAKQAMDQLVANARKIRDRLQTELPKP